MSQLYTVTLRSVGDDVPARARIESEVRYVNVLEKALGGPEDVVRTYRAWLEVSESCADQVDSESVKLAVQWPRATDTARQAAMRNLGDLPECFFELRLERTAA